MATTLELPIKRTCEEIGSDSVSGLEASKKAKADTPSGDYSDFCYSFNEFLSRYGDSLDHPLKEWKKNLKKLNETCKIQEIKLYLISIEQEDAAKKIRSFEDDLARSIESSPEFRNKGWILRTKPGSFDNYQRLYVGDFLYCNDEITLEYHSFYYTYSMDLAFKKIFNELQSSIKFLTNSIAFHGDLSPSDLERICNEASMKYTEDLPSYIVETAIEEILCLKQTEQNLKEWVSLCTKFRHEVVARMEENHMEVLMDIKKKDVASFPFIKNANDDRVLHTLENAMKYINSATKGEYSEEELIGRYFSREGPLLYIIPETYADYLEEKIQIAAKLHLI